MKKTNVRLVRKVIGYNMIYSSRLNYIPTGFIHASYMMVVKKEIVIKCEILNQ